MRRNRSEELSSATSELSYLKQISEKLDVLIALLLNAMPSTIAPINAKVSILAELGMSPAQIGRVIGKKANYVSAVLGKKRG